METVRICDFPGAPGLFATFYMHVATINPSSLYPNKDIFTCDPYDMGVYSIAEDLPKNAFEQNWEEVFNGIDRVFEVMKSANHKNLTIQEIIEIKKDFLSVNIQGRIAYEGLKPKIKEFVFTYIKTHPDVTFVALHRGLSDPNRIIEVKKEGSHFIKGE